MIRLAIAGIRQHLRPMLGVVAAVALTTSLVVAGLMLGDVLRASLAQRVDAQLGPVTHVLETPDRRFSVELADRLDGVPLLRLAGVARGEGSAGGITLLGVDARMTRLASGFVEPAPGEVALPARTMALLGVSPGDDLIVRVQRPGALPREAAIMQDEGSIVGLRLVVRALDTAWPAQAAWRAQPDLPHNAFVSLSWLQERGR